MNKLEQTKKIFKGVQLSTYVVILAIAAIFLMPIVDKYFQIEYKSVPFHWVELSAGWGLLAVGILIRFIDKWKGSKIR